MRSPSANDAWSPNGPLRPPLWELSGIVAIVFFYDFASAVGAHDFANVVGPIALIIILGLSSFRLVYGRRSAFLTPLFWFRIATAVYFGFGNLVPYIAQESTVFRLQNIFAFFPPDVTKLNMIVALCVLTVLATSHVINYFFFKIPNIPHQTYWKPTDVSKILKFGVLFFAVGSFFNYVIFLPVSLGWIQVTIPGALKILGSTSLIGIFFISLWAAVQRGNGVIVIALIAVLETCVGIIALNKSIVILTLLMISLGYLYHRVTIIRAAAVSLTVLVVVIVLHPMISYARLQHASHYDNLMGGTISERLDFNVSYFEQGDVETGLVTKYQGGLARFSYVQFATFAIGQYDIGDPGNSLKDAMVVLVPRILWPDKPRLVPGYEFAVLVTQRYGQNSFGPGLFAETYWSFGWLGIPILMVPFGLVMTALSRFAISIVEGEQWLLMPVVYLAMRMGMRVDGHYVTDVIGASAIILASIVVLRLAQTCFSKPNGLRARNPMAIPRRKDGNVPGGIEKMR